MDPFSVIVGVSFGALLGALGIGRARRRRLEERLHETEAEVRQVKREAARRDGRIKKARTDLAATRELLTHTRQDLARVSAERDEYRRIAATHDPGESGPAEPVITVPVWRGRQYSGHPAMNLEALCSDLAPFLERTLALTLRLDPQGGWKRQVRERGPFTLKGPGERVLTELRVLLEDEDLRLMRGRENKEWADPDSPLFFLVDLDFLDVPAPEVLVRTVEVLRVETRVEERIIEQPVLIEVPVFEERPQQPDARPVGLSREEVLALFEVELDSKLADLGMERVGTEPATSGTGQAADGGEADETKASLHRGARAIQVKRRT